MYGEVVSKASLKNDLFPRTFFQAFEHFLILPFRLPAIVISLQFFPLQLEVTLLLHVTD